MAEAGETRQPSLPSHLTDGHSISDSCSGHPTDGDSINDSRSGQAEVGSCDNQLVLADPEVQRGTSYRPPVSPPKFFFDTWNRKTMIWLFLIVWLHSFTVALFHSTLWFPSAEASVAISTTEDAPRPKSLIAADFASVMASVAIGWALDRIGLVIGLSITVVSYTIALVLFSVADNILTLCVGQVFYAIGFSASGIAFDVLIADTLTLRMRGLAMAFLGTPYVISAFGSIPIFKNATSGIGHSFQSLSSIFIGVIVPSGVGLIIYLRLVLNKRQGKGPAAEGILQLLRLVLGILKSPLVLAILVFTAVLGVVLWLTSSELVPWYAMLPVLYVFLAVLCLAVTFEYLKHKFKILKVFTRWQLGGVGKGQAVSGGGVNISMTRPSMRISTVYSAYILGLAWNAAGSSWLRNNWAYYHLAFESHDPYWLSAYSYAIGQLWLFPIGFILYRYGLYRPCIIIALVLQLLGAMLVMLVPVTNHSVAMLILGEGLLTAGRLTVYVGQTVAALSVSQQGDTSMLLSMLFACEKIGNLVGSTLSDALWKAAMLPQSHPLYLSAEAFLDFWSWDNRALGKALSFPVGSPERIAVVQACEVAQRNLLLIGSGLVVLACASIVAMENRSVLKAGRVGEVNL